MSHQRIDDHAIGICLAALAIATSAGCQILPDSPLFAGADPSAPPSPLVVRLPPANISAPVQPGLPAAAAIRARVVPAAYYEAYDDPTAIAPVETTVEGTLATNETTTSETLPSPPAQDSDGLTMGYLQQMALAASPTVGAARARVESLGGKWVQVGLLPNPTVGYTADDIGANGSDGRHGGFVGQRIITGGKLRLNRAVVAEEMDIAEQQLAAAQQRVMTDVQIGYYDVLISQRKLDLANELVRISEQAVKASRALVEAQEISTVGLLQTEVEGENALILARRATHEQAAAWRRLSAVIGNPHFPPQQLHGNLDEPANALSWDEQLDRLVTESPEIAAAITEVERARWALNRACVEAKPDVDLKVAVQHDSMSGDTVTGVLVGLPLPLWNRNQGGIQQAHSDVVAAENGIQRVKLRLRRRLASVFQEYADASYQVSRYADTILPKAQRTVDLVGGGFQAGEVGYLDMLTAQRTFSQTNLAYIEALRSLWRARLQIDGLLLDGSLDGGA